MAIALRSNRHGRNDKIRSYRAAYDLQMNERKPDDGGLHQSTIDNRCRTKELSCPAISLEVPPWFEPSARHPELREGRASFELT